MKQKRFLFKLYFLKIIFESFVNVIFVIQINNNYAFHVDIYFVFNVFLILLMKTILPQNVLIVENYLKQID